MTQDEIAEGNRLIMLFDGWKLETRQTFDPDNNRQNPGSNNYQVYVKKGEIANEITCRPEDIQHDIVYHQSWDAIMGVLIKINKMGKMISINLWTDYPATECKIYNWEMGAPQQMAELENPLHAIWYAIVEFIKWHNLQNKN